MIQPSSSARKPLEGRKLNCNKTSGIGGFLKRGYINATGTDLVVSEMSFYT
jgi:hypothetical protein